jgi:hypothetical protein
MQEFRHYQGIIHGSKEIRKLNMNDVSAPYVSILVSSKIASN